MKVIFISGPYAGKYYDHRSYFEISRHILEATEMAAKLAHYGYGFFCPHSHSAHFEVVVPELKPDFWYNLDMHFLKACDAILMLPTWEASKGARAERDWALRYKIPVFYSFEELLKEMPLEEEVWLQSTPLTVRLTS